MTLAVPPLAPSASEQEAAPLLLPPDLRLTPEQFERVCEANPEAVLELAADGHRMAMTPTGGETSSRNGRLLIQHGMALPSCDASPRLHRPAPEDGRLSGQRCPPWLAANPAAVGGGDVGAAWRW